MAQRMISTRIAIEGEEQYRQSVAKINGELKTMKSAMALCEVEFKGNANSMAALTAKGKLLTEQQAKQAQKVAEIKNAYENARKAQEIYAQKIEEQKAKIAAATKHLDELKNSTEDTSAEQEKLTASLEEMQIALNRSVESEAAAANGANVWEQKLNSAKTGLLNLNQEIHQNDIYLDQVKSSADHCATSIDKYGKATKSAAESTDNASASVSEIAQVLAAAGVAGSLKEIAGAFIDCTRASIEFESAMTGVYKTIDGTDQQLAAIREGIMEMSLTTPAAATDIAAVAESAGQLGIQTDNIMSFTNTMVNLGVATNLSADAAATALAQFANITNMDPSKYENIGSVIVALGNNSATTESKIVDMAQGMASAATNAGLSETEIMAVAAAVSSLGIESQAGGTAMSTLISKLQLAVETGAGLDEFAYVANMDAEKFQQAWGEDAVGALNAFIVGLRDTERNGASAIKMLSDMDIKEVRLRNAILSLSNADGLLTKSLNIANTAFAENNALQEEATKRYATTESKIQLLENATYALKVSVGDVLLPVVGKAVDAGTDVVNWLNDVVERSPWVVSVLTAITASVGVLALGITGYTVGVKIATAAQAAYNAMLAANPAGLVATAIAALVVGIIALSATMEDNVLLLEDLTVAANGLDDAVKDINEAYKVSQDEILGTAIAAEKYINRLAELEAQGLTSAEAQAEYNGAVSILNTLIPELNIKIDETTGLIEGGTAALKKNTAAWKQNAIAQALQEKLKGTMEAYAAVVLEAGENQQKANEASARASQAVREQEACYARIAAALGTTTAKLDKYSAEEWNAAEATLYMDESTAGLTQEYRDLAAETISLQTETDLYAEAVAICEEKMAEYEGIVNTAYDTMNGYSDAVSDATGTQDEFSAAQGNATSTITGLQIELQNLRDIYIECKNAARDSIDATVSGFETMDTKSKTSIDTLIKAVESQKTYVDAYEKNYQALEKRQIEGMDALLSTLRDGSQESFAILAGMAEASDEEVKALVDGMNQVEGSKETWSETMATSQLSFTEAMDNIQKRLDEAVIEFNQEAAAYSAGVSTMSGLIVGMQSKEGELIAVCNNVKRILSEITSAEAEIAEKSKKQTYTSSNGTKTGQGGRTSHATGLPYVPYDGYLATLHKGERVLTAAEAQAYIDRSMPRYITEADYAAHLATRAATDSGKPAPTVNITNYNYSPDPLTPSQIAREERDMWRRLIDQ